MIVEKEGGKYVLRSKTTGKVLGKHETKAAALKQERAIQAAKHRPGKG